MPHVSLPMVQLWWFQTKKQVSEEWVSRALTVLFAAWGGPPKPKPWRKHWEPGGQILQRPSFVIWDFRTQGSGYLDFQKILLLLNTFVQQFFFFFFFLQPHLWHMGVPRPVQIRATAASLRQSNSHSHTDRSHICDLHPSLRQHQILKPWVRPGIEPSSSWIQLGL